MNLLWSMFWKLLFKFSIFKIFVSPIKFAAYIQVIYSNIIILIRKVIVDNVVKINVNKYFSIDFINDIVISYKY